MSTNSITTYFCILICFVSSTLPQLIPIGSQQSYKLTNRVEFYDVRRIPVNIGYEIESKLSVASIWNSQNDDSQLLHFVLSPEIELSTKVQKNKNDIPKYNAENAPQFKEVKYLEAYAHFVKGQIVKLYTHKEDKDAFYLNFKRALASLFQFQSENQLELLQETDLLGQCSVSYKFKSSTEFTKTKHACRDWDLKVGQRHEIPFGIERDSRQELHYKLTPESMLFELDAVETHQAQLAIKPNAGVKIESHIFLHHISSTVADQIKSDSAEKAMEQFQNFHVSNIEADIDGRVSKIDSNLKTLLKAYKDEMENLKIGKLSTAYIFTKLLPVARITKTKDLVQILKSKTMAENLNQIVDLLGATQTTESHTAFMQVFNFAKEDDFDVIERYLQALSISTRPNKDIFLNLFEQLNLDDLITEYPKLHDTLVQTLASIANKLSVTSPNMFEDKIVIKIRDYILHNLSGCKESNCKTVYIRGLQNLKDSSTINTLVEIALQNDKAASVQAMNALKTFDYKLFTNKERKLFEIMFYQISKKFDSSVRTSSLDILLAMKPSRKELELLLDYLDSNDEAFEVKRYLIEKLRLLASRCAKFRALLKDVIKDKPKINNYHIIGQNGMTSVLERSLSEAPGFNESLYSSQEVFKGVLKQGNVDYKLRAGNNEISSFKLGLFTSGLSSFVSSGDSSEENDESEEMRAGMEITVQNVLFRPLIFFSGQSELMGHVWSGTASEPTAAYQATLIQQDHEEYILLQNGATIFFQVVGAKSIDLNGQVQFSLWNRNAQTQIRKNAGETISGKVTYGTPFIEFENEFSIESSPRLVVNANVDFYSDTKLCIQLEKPKSSLRHRIENTLKIVGGHKIRKTVTVNSKIPGRTLALNQKNNEMCNTIG